MELRDYLNIVKRRWVIIAVITVLAIGGALAFSFARKPVCEAKATCMVDITITGPSEPAVQGESTSPTIKVLLGTINNIAVSSPVLDKVSNKLNHTKSLHQLQNAVTSKLITDTQLLVITARDLEPTTAAREANATADYLIDYYNQNGAKNGNKIEIKKVDPASIPSSPISPKPVRNGILGGVFGLLLGCACAAAVEYMDVSVKSKKELGQLVQRPVLAEIPFYGDGSVAPESKKVTGDSGILEQARTLRTKIQNIDIKPNLRTILITSPSLGEGKTFFSRQLAMAFAAGDRNVILVDADLREAENLSDRHSKGLTDALTGTLDLEAVIQKTATDRLWLLPSGPPPPNPSELLDSIAVQNILDSLITGYDIVIIDSSSIGMFSDPLVLASKVDGTILVAEVGSTSAESLKAATELLTGPRINLLGAVLNKVKLGKRR